MRLPALIAALLLSLAVLPAHAVRALDPDDAPAPLKSWIPWVLQGVQEEGCPFAYNALESRRCVWPARLALDLDKDGGRFAHQFQVFAETMVVLPGSAKAWPSGVKVNGKPAPVVEANGLPAVRVTPGTRMITGSFAWDRMPESLQIPPDTGLVELHRGGEPVAFPVRDAQGRLWLAGEAPAAAAKEHLGVTAHRLITDEVPLTVTTRIELSVSGAARELVLGGGLLPGMVPMALDSALPARIEPDGRLRVQMRPGKWELTLTARASGPQTALAAPRPDGPWAAEEVWAFDARPALRLVTVEGAPAVDPQQTTLPDEWKRLPAYRMAPGGTLRLVERRRGDPQPAPDRLSLQRALWLDFDGGGYTAHDRMVGTLSRTWRLQAAAPAVLGRAAVDGQDQPITRLAREAPPGIEVRQGRADISADSRIEGALRELPATGWQLDFHSARAELNLPPGWRLVAAAGVDRAPGSWVGDWSLLDFFVVLVIGFATGRLFGWRWGAAALAALALAWPEPDAPRWVWVNVLAAAALLRVLPQGRLHAAAALYRRLALLALVLILLPFAVQQVRTALFPVLEKPWAAVAPQAPAVAQRPVAAPAPAAPQAGGAEPEEARAERKALRREQALRDYASSAERLTAIDPAAVVQTGPGLPRWQWNRYSLEWNGPVEQGQRLSLWLVSPAANAALAALRLALLALLAWRLMELARPRPAAPAAMPLLLAALLLPGIHADPAQAELPTPELLQQLKGKLLPPPDCLPACADIARMEVSGDGDTLRLRLEVHAADDTALPLPGSARGWQPSRVTVDDRAAAALARDGEGTLWLALPTGVHQVMAEGPLPAADTVSVPLPLRPRRAVVELKDWRVEGVFENGSVGESIELSRAGQPDAEAKAAADAPQARELPPFLRVERRLILGLRWQVETTVTRLTPPGTAVVAEVPLLPGEAVTTAGVRAADGVVRASLAPQAGSMSWESELPVAQRIVLTAAKQDQWVEHWRLEAASLWHVDLDGIAPIHHQDEAGRRAPQWRPWPGESVQIGVSRPEGVPGPTLTLDGSSLTLSPGARATDAGLSLSLRSSRGGEHEIMLPEGAVLQSVAIDGRSQPIRAEGRRLALPVSPGSQSVAVAWRQPGGVETRFTAPEVDLGAPSVNAGVDMQLPADRWVLFARGPALGPAVLVWGVLLVVLVASPLLARVPLAPLKAHQWALLGVGLTQTPVEVAAVVVGWLFALGWRRRYGQGLGNNRFNLAQIGLALWTLAALAGLFYAVQQGLLGRPDMMVAGNGSAGQSLRWFHDRAAGSLPQPWVLSLPILVYRLLMLAWALWLARALLDWLRWGWQCWSEGGLWRQVKITIPMRTRARPAAQEKPPAEGGQSPGMSDSDSRPT